MAKLRKSEAGTRDCLQSADGAVSVFLIIALAVVFMFVAVFIDFSRIAAMKVQSERLARAAVRSVMSSYDPMLQQEYGLYAFGDTSGNLIMGKVLNESLSPGERGDALRLMAMEIDSSGLQLQRPLGDHDIFNRQIMEDMKYKAPIDFTLELAGKFKPLSQSMKEASNTVDVLRKLRKLYDKREEALDRMLEKQRTAGRKAEALARLVMDPPGSSIPDEALGGGIRSAADAASQYEDYRTKLQEDAGRPQDEKLYASMIQTYEDGVSSIGSRISSEAGRMQQEQEKLLEEALQLWEEAGHLNDEMKLVIAEAENRSSNEGYDLVTRDRTPGAQSAEELEAGGIQEIRKQAGQLIHSDELLDRLKDELDTQRSRGQAVQRAVSSLLGSLGGGGMKGAVLETSRTLRQYIASYGSPGPDNIVDRNQAMLEQYRSSDKERKAMEKQASRKLKEAGRVINAINGLDDRNGEIREEFRRLQKYYDESLRFNQSQSGRDSGMAMDDDPYDAGKAAMDNMDGMFGFMGQALAGARDELFQNEYAVHYFQHFDPAKLTGLASGAAGGDGLAEEFRVDKQEVEYILYGLHNPVGNVSAAYAEIFASRLAIRTMEGLVVNSKMGNPLAILAAALLYGVEKAIADMIELCEKGEIELSRYVPFKLTYRDHLRIFMFVHSNNERKLSRMLALIRFHTGVNPAERLTYASGEVTTAMRLLFLPGVSKAIGAAFGTGGDEVQGSRYMVTRTADFSY